MAHVNVHNVQVLDSVAAAFTNPMQFEITFECVKQIADGAWPRAHVVFARLFLEY
jgi:hypothetical protein